MWGMHLESELWVIAENHSHLPLYLNYFSTKYGHLVTKISVNFIVLFSIDILAVFDLIEHSLAISIKS